MIASPEEEAAFLKAREATDRGALARYLNAEMDDSEDGKRKAEARFRSLRLLADPFLISLSKKSLDASLGTLVDHATPLPMTIWQGGATNTYGGMPFNKDIGAFVRLLRQRAEIIAPKREGWVVEPTTNIDGHRTNSSTVSMSAVFLDCDNTGTWDGLLEFLADIGLAYIAYQSGGWSPETPKWRIVLPLQNPVPVTDDTKRTMWRDIYHHIRVVIGSLAGLSGDGFDPKTDGAAIPWFLCEKRNATDSSRDVRWHAGAALDALALVVALPTVPETSKDMSRRNRKLNITAMNPLNSDKIEHIVNALIGPTSNIRSNRRELYRALAGTILDRNVLPDDMLAIINAVSESYPRYDAVRHADNVRYAVTTIKKWEKGEKFTQIGELNDLHPMVAATLDAVLPNPADQAIILSTKQMLDSASIPLADSSTATPVDKQPPVAQEPNEAPIDDKTLRKIAVQVRRKKINKAAKYEKEGNAVKHSKNKAEATLLDRLIKGQSLLEETQVGREYAISRATNILAFKLPRLTPRASVRQFFRKSVNAMLYDGESPEYLLSTVESTYLLALKKRIELVDARNAKMIAEFETGL